MGTSKKPSRSPCTKRRRGGRTVYRPRAAGLIEVMVACAILGVVMATTANAIAFGAQMVGDARRRGEAERIAAFQMEPLLKVARDGGSVTDGAHRYDNDGRSSLDGPYDAQWNVEPDRPIPGAGRLSVAVAFTGMAGHRRAIGLVSYLPPAAGP
jgi:hypothetical protein